MRRDYKSLAAARRKKEISDKFLYSWGICPAEPYYPHLNMYSKRKIHCSCPMCSPKTTNRNQYGSFHTPSAADRRKMDSQKQKMKEVMYL